MDDAVTQTFSSPNEPLKAEFVRMLMTGERPSITDFVSRSNATEKSRLFRDLVQIDFEFQRKQDNSFSHEAYYELYPDYTWEIERVFSERDISTMAERSIESSTGLESLDGFELVPCDASTLIDGYEILGKLGQGGMGIVYKARQMKLDRLVALKMIRSGEFADAEQIQRFLAEATAAANLDHPGIVPVYDVGESNGRHFYSMAFIEGESLKAYCNGEPISNTEAARLTKEIATALQFAHEKGLIHRDIKPANVLLDKSLTPKILDFGLVKSIGSDSELTATRQVLGTPQYMSPEQAIASEVVTPSFDIYSTGALLYHLLTGHAPFRGPDAIETIRQVREMDPIPPRTYNQRIDADLETICLKCLEKEPARRYATSQDLADELDRFLSNKPILARPITKAEKSWRWCKRNPLPAGLGTAFVVALFLGTMISSYFAWLASTRATNLANSVIELKELNEELSDANHREKTATQEAQKNAKLAYQQSDEMLGLIETLIIDIADRLAKIPNAENERRTLLQTGLEGLEYVSVELKKQDRSKSNLFVLLAKLGGIYREVGDENGLFGTKKSIEHYEMAVEIGEELLTTATENRFAIVSNQLNALSGLGNMYLDSGRGDASKKPFERAMELADELVTEDILLQSEANQRLAFEEMVIAYRNYGDYFQDQGKFEKAISVFRKGETVAREALKLFPGQLRAIQSLSLILERMGDAYYDSGHWTEAEPIYNESMQLSARAFQMEPTTYNQWDLASAWERRGEILIQAKKPKEALSAYERSLELSLPSLADNPDNIRTQLDIAISYCKIGKANSALKNQDGVIESYNKALAIRLPILKSDPTDVQTRKLIINSYQAIANAYLKKNDTTSAIENLKLALAIYDESNEEQLSRLSAYGKRLRNDIVRLED